MPFWNRKKTVAPPARSPRQQWGEDFDYECDNYERKGLVPMRWQCMAYSFAIALAVSVFTNPSMWAHIDRIRHPHANLLKGGLVGVIDLTLFVVTLWAFTGRTFIHRMFSGIAAGVLTAAMLVHAGAINELEATHTENVETIVAIREGLKEIAQGESEGAARAQSDAAMEANSRGQRKLAAQLGRQAESKGAVSDKLADKFIQEAKGVKDKTFLPEWYMNGAMYWAMMVLAFVLGLISVTIAERAKSKARQQAAMQTQYPPNYAPQYPYPAYPWPPQYGQPPAEPPISSHQGPPHAPAHQGSNGATKKP